MGVLVQLMIYGQAVTYGYFGSQNKHSEDERTGQVDNIFWPHNPYPQVDDRNFQN